MTAPKFQIFTGLLKAYENETGKGFRTTASSTISDHAKDEILSSAIEQMAQKAKGNLTIFLNHEYRVPEDVLGSVTETYMQTRGVDSEGNPIVDLDFDVKVNEANPRALQTFDAIKNGVKLGTSIGAIVKAAEKKKGGGLRISDVELLEASIVGIPANPRSWVQYAMKSINALSEEEAKGIVVLDENLEEVLDAIASAQIEGEVDITDKAGCPTCGKAKSMGGDCSNAYHKSIEPEVAEVDPDKEAARTRVTVTVDSDGAQDAPSKSSPESALMDEDRADAPMESDQGELGDNLTMDTEPDVAKDATESEPVDVEAEVLQQFFATADFAAVVTKLQEVTKELVAKDEALRQTKAERDEMTENFVVAKEIIDRIADLPVGRKTQFSGAVSDFRKRFPQYDDEFMKFLEK